ncbi:hypothetical protein [Clostridium drakei]|uniref:hypothetical protein n=1 Tax=Clostridium drakei TaxID=332101 RepID=UPI0013A571D3|nr:hypothetical protein [Clostridium drakei]
METDICCEGRLELLNEVSFSSQHISAGIQLKVTSLTYAYVIIFLNSESWVD